MRRQLPIKFTLLAMQKLWHQHRALKINTERNIATTKQFFEMYRKEYIANQLSSITK